MSNWKEYKFSELCDITRGASPRPIHEYMTNDINGMPWVKISDATKSNSRFIENTVEKIKLSGVQKSVEVFDGDLILSNSATPGLPKFMAINACIHDGWMLLRNFKNITKEFAYWLLLNERNNLVKQGTGTVFINLKTDILKNHIVKIPTIEQQNRIVTILNGIEDKIQLNTKINQTLEQIAQAIFKSWFVDFDPVRAKAAALENGKTHTEAELAAMQAISGKTAEELAQMPSESYAELAEIAKAFPSEFGENGVPMGWEYKPADTLFDIGIGKTPPRKEPEWFSSNSEDMQWISIKDMGNSGAFITESSEYLIPQAIEKFNVRKVPEHTVLLSFKLTLGRVSITTCETTTNEAIAHFKLTDKSYLTTEYLYLFLKNFDFNSLGSTSSIATAVNSKTIKNINILIPNKDVVDIFQNKVINIFNKIKIQTNEINNLIKVRDLLLPRLLNEE